MKALILSLCLFVSVGTSADNQKVEQLYEAADAAYAEQNYQQAAKLVKEALPLSKGTELEADCLSLLAIIHVRLSDYDEAARYAKECYAPM